MEEKQKNSGLGIAGLIMAIIPCTSFIGLILSIVDLCKKDGKKKTCSIIGVVISGIYILFSLMAVAGSGNNSSDNNNTSTPPTSENQVTESQTETTEERIEETEERSTEITKEEKFLKDLENVIDKNIAEKAYDILKNQIGFENLEYKGKMEGLTNYEIIADGYNIILTASDDVYRIFIPNSSYVFYEDEEVKLTLSELNNRTIDQYDRSTYYIIAKP